MWLRVPWGPYEDPIIVVSHEIQKSLKTAGAQCETFLEMQNCNEFDTKSYSTRNKTVLTYSSWLFQRCLEDMIGGILDVIFGLFCC